ncbi:LPXTG cell wall anchor domain-containing protein [Rathayibacter sp. SD072]|uniref:LPXTG cell wall anchor domain-containing protein n=1 Tax=Rathayibacter sp. SD072 TaxID=2781731 RepID=UPI001A959EF2|nr:LPXTG cell wall anchor domain-containing protein [Rathayibacter sp. SD072]MBO0984645.1 LPXTG cell wall anchor domain-containing protein [Rathayibacter sp. SD072]
MPTAAPVATPTATAPAEPTPTAAPAPVDDTCFEDLGGVPSATTTEPVGTTAVAPGGLVVHLEPLTIRDCVVSGEIRVVATAVLDTDGDYTPPTSRWYDLAEFADGGDIPLAVSPGSYFVFAEYIARAEGEADLEHAFYVHFVDGAPGYFAVPPAPAAASPSARPTAAATGARLAETGAGTSAPLLGAGVLLAAGGALLIARRRTARV